MTMIGPSGNRLQRDGKCSSHHKQVQTNRNPSVGCRRSPYYCDIHFSLPSPYGASQTTITIHRAYRTKMSLTNKNGPGPLPLRPENFPERSDLRRAFQVCKTLESEERWVLPESDLAHTRSEGIPLDLTPTCAARVLGFALLYPPSDHGRDRLAAEILECSDSKNDHELLSELAHLYVYGLIRLCTSSVAFRLSFC